MPAAVAITLAAWALLEVRVRVAETMRGKGHRHRDRATRVWIALSLAVAIGAALAVRGSARTPVAGVASMWVGLGLRAWAIVALGSSFRTTVEVDPGQAVVVRGPYRWIRHPSYTGLLLIVAGFGLALGSWLAFAACLVVPLPAIVWRIRVEEAELERMLGDAYRSYAAGRRRLLPGVW